MDVVLVGRIVEVDDVARFHVADRPHEAAQGLKSGGNRLFLGRLEVRLDAVVERVDEARAGNVAQQAETNAAALFWVMTSVFLRAGAFR